MSLCCVTFCICRSIIICSACLALSFTPSIVHLLRLISHPDMANLSLNDNDGSSGASDQDTLAPLPLPGASPWPMMHTFPYQPYPTHAFSSQPPPYHELTSYTYAPGSTGSQHSEGEHGLRLDVTLLRSMCKSEGTELVRLSNRPYWLNCMHQPTDYEILYI